MNKIHHILLAAIVIICAACEKDVPDIAGYTEGNGDDLVTVFHLAASSVENGGSDNQVQFQVINPELHTSMSFEGTVSHDATIRVLGREGAAVCRVRLGKQNIPDGRYIVRINGDMIPDLGLRTVRFTSNRGAEENRVEYPDLEGTGTPEDPYLIQSDGDFQSFMWTLLDDDTHAYGLCFRQTASFDVPPSSMIIDGNKWAATSFSGIYDGAGNELRGLTYMGSSDAGHDSHIALFSEIYDATVKNLNMSRAMIVNVHSNIGIIAGKAEGNCTLENIGVSGTITACGKNIGGLVGENTGALTLSGISVSSLAVNASETQSENVAMLLGRSTGAPLTFEQIRTPDHIFTVTGSRNVGALAGSIENCDEINVRQIALEHSVDSETKDVKIIYAAAFGAGAVAGHIGNSGTLNLENVTVKAPVKGASDIGCLVGNADRLDTVNVSSVLLSSVVNGETSTGGFFGYLGFNNGGTLNFIGSDAAEGGTRYVLKSSATAEVSGGDHTGGLIGYLEGRNCRINFNAVTEIAVNVTGHENVGGAIGYAANISGMNLVRLNFSSATMKVTASTRYAGGVIGRGSNISIQGGNDGIRPVERIPEVTDLYSNFSGVVTASENAGGVIGAVTGADIRGCFSKANVTAGGAAAGGLAGSFKGKISSCAFQGSVKCPGSAGGIIGSADKQFRVEDCVNFADIDGGGCGNLGGIMGYFTSICDENMYLERCYNAGNIKGGKNVGGILGHADYSYTSEYDHLYVHECGNGGDITATGGKSNGVGGIIGFNGYKITEIKSCSNSGHIHATTVMYAVGGIVGVMGKDNDEGGYYVRQCRNTGTVTCSDYNTKIGGVVGHIQTRARVGDWQDAYVEDCLNLGSLPEDHDSDTGGIIGFVSHATTTDRCFNAGIVAHGNAIIGTHSGGSKFYHHDNYFAEGSGKDWPSAVSVSPKDLGNQSVYRNFDFNNVWYITSEGPRLRHCPF